LATLFATDVGEFGLDAGRALRQTAPSDAWWKTLSNTVMWKQAQVEAKRAVPRPKSLRVYSFGSLRVGNSKFAQRFDSLVKSGKINQAYRVVNDQDVVARSPCTMYTLSVDYDHCGSTVLVVSPEEETKTSTTDQEEDSQSQGSSHPLD
jgi:predicted lipase